VEPVNQLPYKDGYTLISEEAVPYLARYECKKGHVNYIDSSTTETITEGSVKHFFPNLYSCWCKRPYTMVLPYTCESAHEKAALVSEYEAYFAAMVKHRGKDLAPPSDPVKRR